MFRVFRFFMAVVLWEQVGYRERNLPATRIQSFGGFRREGQEFPDINPAIEYPETLGGLN
ncbi:hypothetical protein [Methylococcus capsulatus]|uniref:hypothetical protein n=1 Tax=Methylococcus capsulatus TaxID=414 RepID=UPI001EE68B71|nr:hypothetical protein [Methylococcus capsulatus]